LEAGRELVGFAAEYVSFQLNFFANLATMPIAVVSAFAAPHVQAAAASVDAVATPKADVERTSATSKKTGTDIEQPKKIRSTVPESDSTTGTTAKTRDKDGDPAASDQADSDAAAPTAHGKPDVTQKQPKTGSTTSPTTSGAGQADAGSPHEPQHEHRGNAKDGGDKGD
jgi:hypothetical protein